MHNVVYYSVHGHTTRLLRFYSDGSVIGVPIAGGGSIQKVLSNLDTWFTAERYNPVWSKGTYQYDGIKIKFDLKSDSGIVVYEGYTDDSRVLFLKVHSLINDNRFENSYTPSDRYNQIVKNAIRVEVNIDVPEKPVQPPIKTVMAQPETYSQPQSSSLKNRFYAVLFFVLLFTGCYTCASRHRVGCHCWDGSNSHAKGSGACSHHGGVMYWKYEYWWNK